MTASVRLRLVSAAVTWGLAASAVAQPAAPAAEPAPAASAAPVNDQAAQDRIMTLVRSGKCGPAKAEATRIGDLSLADQIGVMCGARSSNPFPAKRGGSGGGAGGRRGGGGG